MIKNCDKFNNNVNEDYGQTDVASDSVEKYLLP